MRDNRKIKSELKIYKKGSALPGKSFMHIISLDITLRNFLSYAVRAPAFDYYICNNLHKFFRHKDNKKITRDFINFIVSSDNGRIEHIYSSKIFTRPMAIEFLSFLKRSCDRCKDISKRIKKNETISDSDCEFFNQFRSSWIYSPFFEKEIYGAHSSVMYFLNTLNKHYNGFIVSGLLKNRKYDDDSTHLKTDAYEVITTLLAVYDPVRSKVPLNNLMQYYIANKKNKIIQSETWGNGITMLSLDSAMDDSGDDVQAAKEVESLSYVDRIDSDKVHVIDMSFQSLPKPFKHVISLIYGLTDPLEIEEEIRLRVNNLQGE